jgi:ABC-2 type transport system ATP-binding protein
MIEVERLSKWYGDFQALRDVGFSVTGCQVAGFLGANGAGKTTTMRILACFLPATSGVARVGGFDVFTESLSVRQVLGYMPQNAPLYGDMRVEEYLRFMAEMRDVEPSRIRLAVDTAMSKAGLVKPDDMHRRLISALSHGYQQRVALAACLLHTPKVLILDEPTAGLDPVEIRNTRNLIRGLGTECTVLLSTHILFEVQQICEKVIVIKNGAVVADARIDDLVRTQGRRRMQVAVAAPAEQVAGALTGISGVEDLQPAGNGGADGSACGFVFTAPAEVDPRPAIGRVLAERNWPLLELHAQQETLEDIYVRMTRAER